MRVNTGKDTEGIVRDSLLMMQEKKKAVFIRLYDTTSAGNFLPGQPGDFVLHAGGRGCLLEVKSSIKYASLLDTTLRNVFSLEQIKGARLWSRSGAATLCVFHHVGKNFVEIWEMKNVVEAYLSPPRQRKLKGDPLALAPTESSRLMTILFDLIKV
jgi:hypothetical protein